MYQQPQLQQQTINQPWPSQQPAPLDYGIGSVVRTWTPPNQLPAISQTMPQQVFGGVQQQQAPSNNVFLGNYGPNAQYQQQQQPAQGQQMQWAGGAGGATSNFGKTFKQPYTNYSVPISDLVIENVFLGEPEQVNGRALRYITLPLMYRYGEGKTGTLRTVQTGGQSMRGINFTIPKTGGSGAWEMSTTFNDHTMIILESLQNHIKSLILNCCDALGHRQLTVEDLMNLPMTPTKGDGTLVVWAGITEKCVVKDLTHFGTPPENTQAKDQQQSAPQQGVKLVPLNEWDTKMGKRTLELGETTLNWQHAHLSGKGCHFKPKFMSIEVISTLETQQSTPVSSYAKQLLTSRNYSSGPSQPPSYPPFLPMPALYTTSDQQQKSLTHSGEPASIPNSIPTGDNSAEPTSGTPPGVSKRQHSETNAVLNSFKSEDGAEPTSKRQRQIPEL